MYPSFNRRSAGLSLGGFVMVLFVLSIIAVIVMKILPSYMEFHSVKATLNEMSTQSFKSEADVKLSIAQKFSINYVSSINPRDVDISHANGVYDISVDYDVVKPVVGNLSISAHFSYEVKTQARGGD